MKFNTKPATHRISVLAQDPTIMDWDGNPLFTKVEVPNERVTPGPKGSRIHVVDYDSSTDKYIAPRAANLPLDMLAEIEAELAALPKSRRAAARSRKINELLADPHFHAQNVYALTASTLLIFERALGRRISWGFDQGSHQIKIAPHGFQDMNAFYSRNDEMLTFGYFPKSPTSEEFAFTCLSRDVVVHEATHAILDGLRTEYFRPSSVDQGAFHEALADIVALLSVFHSEDLVTRALGGEKTDRTILKSAFTPANLRKTFLSGLAEQFGQALSAHGFTGFRGDALRRSAEMTPDPNMYEREREYSEVHDFGEILVAAVFNAFLEIWQARVKPLHVIETPSNTPIEEADESLVGRIDRERAVEEGAKAAKHLLQMCIRALDYLPPVHMAYGDYLSAILTADRETVLDDNKYGYRDVLLTSFASYGIQPAVEGAFWLSPEARWDNDLGNAAVEEGLVYGFAGHAEMQWDRESLFRFLWENNDFLQLHPQAYTKVVSVRPVIRFGPDGAVVRETVVEYIQLIDVMARDLAGMGITKPAEMDDYFWLQLQGGGTMIFNDYGRLKYNIGTNVASGRQSQHLASLWRFGYFDKAYQDGNNFAELHRKRALKTPREHSRERW